MTADQVYDRHGIRVVHGEALDALAQLDDASADSVICDPPYGLGQHTPAQVVTALTAWANGDRTHVPDGHGFLNRAWDSFVPPPAVWDECLRVLKPGGYLLAFAGSRTIDLMALSVRLAGFEIRDTIMWLNAGGFPKNLDVSKAIDNAAGADREVVGQGYRVDRKTGAVPYGSGTADGVYDLTAPATPDAKQWSGWGTALRPSHEPVVMARKPLGGTVAASVLAHGTGAINVDGCRIPARDGGVTVNTTRSPAGRGEIFSGYNQPGPVEYVTPSGGRWPANVLLGHAERCESDGCDRSWCPVAELDHQSGTSHSAVGAQTYRRADTETNRADGTFQPGKVGNQWSGPGYGDAGGASRFFQTFRYESKAPTSERPMVNGNAHPTTKPLALMRWAVRLVTQPGGLVVDPFAGSGTTGHAARAEGMRALLIEREADYLPLIRARLDARARTPATSTGEVSGDEPLDLLDLLDTENP